MKNTLFCVLLLCLISLINAFEPHFMTDPAISPDGSQICFVFMDDLWIVPFEGGTARRLTTTEASENGPVFSPDGKLIAFNSNRDGYNKIYTIPVSGGLATRIGNRSFELNDWYPDGKSLLAVSFNSSDENIYFKIDLNNPNKALAISNLTGMFSSVSPDAKNILFNRGGDAYRESYTGSHNGDLYTYDIQNKKFNQITKTDSSERYPTYSYTSKNVIYYCASDGKVFQIFKSSLNDMSKREALTSFDTWSARDISIARQNDNMTFEFFDQIWTLNPVTKKSAKVNIDIAEDCLSDFTKQEVNYNKAKNFAVSPNGKLTVYSYKYDLFAVPTAGGDVKQLTHNQPGIENIVIAYDNETIFYSSFLKGNQVLYKLNINTPDKSELVEWSKDKRIESLSFNNDKRLYIQYSQKDKRNRYAVMDTTWTDVKPLISDLYVGGDVKLSEDKKYLAFISTSKSYQNILYLLDMKKNEYVPLYTYQGYLGNPNWSKNNDALFINRGKNIVRIDLSPRNEFYNDKDNWQDILKKEKPKSNNLVKTEYEYSNLENRITPVVSKSGWSFALFTTKDSLLYYVNSIDGKTSLRKIKFDGSDDSEVCSFVGEYQSYQISNDLKTAYYNSNDYIYKLLINTKKPEQISFKHNYEYNTIKLNQSVFEQVWASFQNNFYDPEMHNKNWDEVYNRFYPYSQYMLNTDVLNSIVNELIGELNASHTGFYPRSEDNLRYKQSCLLGLEYDFTVPLSEGVLIKKVYRNAILADLWNIKAGDIIYSINGITINENNPLETLLEGKMGEKITIKFKHDKTWIETIVKGLNYSQHSQLRYDNWVAERAQIVAKATNNQVGYLHIKGMDKPSLAKFEQDLFAKNFNTKALIIDIRENGGGNIHDDLIEILTKKQYAFTRSRYMGDEKTPFPSDVYDKPIVLLINENSFSDAEIFPILFKHFKLGTIIGMPTSGSVIGTGSVNFMDGSSMRMPSNGWYTMDGTNMEGTGAKPDILVPHSLNDLVNDNDLQLDTAIKELMKKIK